MAGSRRLRFGSSRRSRSEAGVVLSGASCVGISEPQPLAEEIIAVGCLTDGWRIRRSYRHESGLGDRENGGALKVGPLAYAEIASFRVPSADPLCHSVRMASLRWLQVRTFQPQKSLLDGCPVGRTEHRSVMFSFQVRSGASTESSRGRALAVGLLLLALVAVSACRDRCSL